MAITPGAGDTQPREDLLGAYEEFNAMANGLIAEALFPAFNVEERTGTFGVVPREARHGKTDTRRAPKAAPSRSTWTPGSDTFTVTEYSHESLIDVQDQDVYKTWFDLEDIETGRVAEVIKRDMEEDAAEALFNDTTFPASGATGMTVGTPWNNPAAGTPVLDHVNAIDDFLAQHGVMPNFGVYPHALYTAMTNTADFRSRMPTTVTTPGLVPADIFRTVMGLPPDFEVFIPWGRYLATPGAASPTYTNFWSNNRAGFGRREMGNDLRRPQAIRRFVRSNVEPRIQTYRPNPKQTAVLATEHQGFKVLADSPFFMFRGVYA